MIRSRPQSLILALPDRRLISVSGSVNKAAALKGTVVLSVETLDKALREPVRECGNIRRREEALQAGVANQHKDGIIHPE